MDTNEFLKQFGWQISQDTKEVGFDGTFQSGFRAFSDGLQPSSNDPAFQAGYNAAREAFRLILKRREEAYGRYRQLTIPF